MTGSEGGTSSLFAGKRFALGFYVFNARRAVGRRTSAGFLKSHAAPAQKKASTAVQRKTST